MLSDHFIQGLKAFFSESLRVEANHSVLVCYGSEWSTPSLRCLDKFVNNWYNYERTVLPVCSAPITVPSPLNIQSMFLSYFKSHTKRKACHFCCLRAFNHFPTFRQYNQIIDAIIKSETY